MKITKLLEFIFGKQKEIRFKRMLFSIVVLLVTVGLITGLLFCVNLPWWQPAGKIDVEIKSVR